MRRLITTIFILMSMLISCKKEKKGCLIKRTGSFYVENQSNDTCKFILIQKNDTIKETILPYKKYEYTINAGDITMAYVYRSDTLYRKSRPDFKMQRCEIDGDIIR